MSQKHDHVWFGRLFILLSYIFHVYRARNWMANGLLTSLYMSDDMSNPETSDRFGPVA